MDKNTMGGLARALRNLHYYEKSGRNPVLSPFSLIRRLFIG
ncbi:hypothetical protein SHANETTE_205 [Bacillus phage Shanette]|uniref:Uncharacterized protein n=3 Tax=Siminovitchvirus TaxID=1918721 RepID=S5M4R5_9CAUD|nr:hypothetical protein OZ73_gp134 [Bacillus phage CP-51]YP_009215981.1 hypothetical protein AVV47_gp091 [Bacillus phage JL]YP_009216200.1 hypothetical protein AVV46_gp092 [Bacillus phage Shanette]AGR46871.1 hypothetical protein JL_205 [Bacillus phage JL]AGR47096.1 hypothetical protein SHANETTE_205 [Bacillus phage Shanette]AID50569.1 hypothetical protein [Bacillus phage CP-51]